MNQKQTQFIKPLPATHSHRTAEARAHKALKAVDRNKPWRSNLNVFDGYDEKTGLPTFRKYSPPLIVAKHPQRPRRSGKSKATQVSPVPQLPVVMGLRKFASSFMAAAVLATASVATRYAKRAPRGRHSEAKAA